LIDVSWKGQITYGIKAILFVLVAFTALLVPAAGAVTISSGQSGSQNYIIQDSTELISPLKMHIAYVGKTQQVRMDGVIMYIDRISGGTGSGGLRQIEKDNLTAAFQVPVMRTVEEITETREEMRHQSKLFSDETNAQLAAFNGSVTDRRLSAEATLHPVEESFSCLRYSSWLASRTTRAMVFNQSTERRMAILEYLSLHGMDVLPIRKIFHHKLIHNMLNWKVFSSRMATGF
jgi:hypothetical protein